MNEITSAGACGNEACVWSSAASHVDATAATRNETISPRSSMTCRARPLMPPLIAPMAMMPSVTMLAIVAPSMRLTEHFTHERGNDLPVGLPADFRDHGFHHDTEGLRTARTR